jgi:4-hydroxy-tetrahydrodipicolinate reductase
MGRTLCRAFEGEDDLELVAAVDPAGAGRTLGELGAAVGPSSRLRVAGGLDALVDAGAEVAVDFTVAAAARENLRFCAEHGIHAVCGTTGLVDEDVRALGELFSGPPRPNAVLAANFSIGAALLLRCAALCAAFFDAVEVVEAHHDRKRDSPSGTALDTVRVLAEARRAAGLGDFSPDPTEREVLPGARGAVGEARVRVHAIRLPGLVAHEAVCFGGPGQGLTLRHDTYDRSAFVPGVLLALREVPRRPGLTVGLAGLLEPSGAAPPQRASATPPTG